MENYSRNYQFGNLIKIGLETVPRHTHKNMHSAFKTTMPNLWNQQPRWNYWIISYEHSKLHSAWFQCFFSPSVPFRLMSFLFKRFCVIYFSMQSFYHFKIEDEWIGEMERFALNLPVWMANTFSHTLHGWQKLELNKIFKTIKIILKMIQMTQNDRQDSLYHQAVHKRSKNREKNVK